MPSLQNDGAGIRSLLFVPGNSVAKGEKALNSGADAVILDLEDAVAPADKVAARTDVRSLLDGAGRNGKVVLVRINALDTGLALDDLAKVIGGRPWGVMLPKCGGRHDVELLGHYLDVLEAREGLAAGSTRILAISTETAASTLALGAEPVAPLPRLWGSLWGSEDLAASLGVGTNRDEDGRYTFPFQFARSQCLYAASALGIAAVDAVWTNFRDLEGLEREAVEGLRDGFCAKAAIHPAQVEVINRVMSPQQPQLEWARAVIELLKDTAVARLDGRMVDLAHKRIAERMLKREAALSG